MSQKSRGFADRKGSTREQKEASPGALRTAKGSTNEQKEAGPEKVAFHFNPITPEDWRANEAPLADLYQRGIVSAEYVRERLNIPEDAGKGTMAPPSQIPPKPLTDVPAGVPGGREKARPAVMLRTRVPT